MPEVREFQDAAGRSPFGEWFWRLEARAAVRVTRVINRLESGLRPDVEPVGEGVFEARIHFGPGYRVYFGLDGTSLVLLLGGGDKKTQAGDIGTAKDRWASYKAQKKRGYEDGTHP